MDINRDNYEAFLLDLLEGRLSVAEERELKEFLKAHPEHVVDLPDLDLLSLEKIHLSFPDRDLLRKELPSAETSLSTTNFDMFSIARMEGDLSRQQVDEHRSAIHSDERLLQEWTRWQRTRLVPEQIRFPGKNSLKRRKPFRTRMVIMGVLSAAAALTLLLLLVKINPADPSEPDSRISAVVSPSIQDMPVEDQEVISAVPEQEAVELPEQETTEKIPEAILPAVEQESSLRLEEPLEGQAVPVGLPAQPIPEARPIRIAGQLTSSPDLLGVRDQDRIEPLEYTPVSPNLTSYSVGQLAEMDRQTLIRDFAEEHNISLMSVANAGIKGINKLTGSEISLLASRDEDGEISGFQFKSRRLSVRSPIGREE
jgi:hypothetical protein